MARANGAAQYSGQGGIAMTLDEYKEALADIENGSVRQFEAVGREPMQDITVQRAAHYRRKIAYLEGKL